MISPLQALLARTITGLSQKEAARRLDMSHQSLSAIEKGDRDAPTSKMHDIQKFYEAEGIAFTPGGGVEPKSYGLMVWQGRDGFAKFRLDVLEEVRKGNMDICISSVDERLFDKWGAGEVNEHYRAEMAKIANARGSCIVRSLGKKGDSYFPAKNHVAYKWIPENQFGEFPFYIYGNKTAIILFEDQSLEIIIINNAKVSDHYRQQFEKMWDNSELPE